MNQGAAHTALVRDILVECGSLPGVVIAINSCGKATYMTEEGKSYAVPYGWPAPGGPDLLAVVAPHGRLIGLEAKTGMATLTPAQRSIHAALRAVGVTVAVVRSVADARAALDAFAAVDLRTAGEREFDEADTQYFHTKATKGKAIP